MIAISRRASGMVGSAIREILKVTERPGMISLAGGLPAPQLFPTREISAAFATLMASDADACLQYSATEGVRGLREWIAAHHSTAQHQFNADHVLITTGSQQALDLIGKALIDPGDPVLVQNPTYLGAVQAFSVYEPQFRVLPEREGAIDPAALTAAAPAGKLAYVIPNFNNPTGRLMPEDARRALVDASARQGWWMVEDDPYGALYFGAPTPPSLLTLCPQRTIHLGSFSKILSPGLRVGYVVADPAIIRTLALLKQATDLHTPSLNQRIVLSLLASGLYPAQAAAGRRHYGQQCALIMAAIRQHFPAAVRVDAPQGGMFVWCEMPKGHDASDLLAQAIEQRVTFVPGAPFYVTGAKPHTFRLSFATVPAEAIDGAVAVLGRLLHRQLERAPA